MAQTQQHSAQDQAEYDALYQRCAEAERHYNAIRAQIRASGETLPLLQALEQAELSLARANETCANWIITHNDPSTRCYWRLTE
jgi:hypothetical protein